MEQQKKDQIRQILCAILIIIFSMWFSSICDFTAGCRDLREDVLRLHILAQSDSREDQQLKLMVRDRILKESVRWLPERGSKAEMTACAEKHLSEIERIAEEVLREQGCPYSVHASVEKTFFDTRVYENGTMPAGWYDALRIVIGRGEGKNWWCVLYPPLCLPAANPSSAAAELTPAGNRVLSSPQYSIRFLITEIFEKIKNYFFG